MIAIQSFNLALSILLLIAFAAIAVMHNVLATRVDERERLLGERESQLDEFKRQSATSLLKLELAVSDFHKLSTDRVDELHKNLSLVIVECVRLSAKANISLVGNAQTLDHILRRVEAIEMMPNVTVKGNERRLENVDEYDEAGPLQDGGLYDFATGMDHELERLRTEHPDLFRQLTGRQG